MATTKTTYRKEQLIAAYAVLREAKLAKVDTVADKLKIVDAIRSLKPVAAAHDDAMETAREKLKPEGLDAIRKQVKEGGSPSQLEMMKSDVLHREYGEAVGKYARKALAEETDIKVPQLGKECLGKIIEGNPDWTAEQIMALTDVLG